jgi:hypothetical protein
MKTALSYIFCTKIKKVNGSTILVVFPGSPVKSSLMEIADSAYQQ